MARDYFALLGLAPGRYEPRQIDERFFTRREQLLHDSLNPASSDTAIAELDDLYAAFRVLRDPHRQADYLRRHQPPTDPVADLRLLITASLDGGLLRQSRRTAIIERALELGLTEFQTQLLIAEVQYGDDRLAPVPSRPGRQAARTHARGWARATAVGVLALAMFLALVQFVGV